eukprot:scaffold150664_cov37-Tisochrysis_lutea.AAC.2
MTIVARTDDQLTAQLTQLIITQSRGAKASETSMCAVATVLFGRSTFRLAFSPCRCESRVEERCRD